MEQAQSLQGEPGWLEGTVYTGSALSPFLAFYLQDLGAPPDL